MVPPGRYRRGSVSHAWSETTVSENSTSSPSGASAAPPERLYTPVDELLAAAVAERQAQAGAGAPSAPSISLTDDGPYSRTHVFTADYSDTRQHQNKYMIDLLTPALSQFWIVVDTLL